MALTEQQKKAIFVKAYVDARSGKASPFNGPGLKGSHSTEGAWVDQIEARMDEIRWEYADKDLSAIEQLTDRIAETGRKFGLISYTDLVSGIGFRYPNINSGQPHFISVRGEWTGLDRRIVGDCLGYISMRSYKEAKFMASALVVARLESKPSDIFFGWMQELGAISNLSEMAVLGFWSSQVKKAHHWYKYGHQI